MSARLPTSSCISQACAEFLDSHRAARCYHVVQAGLSCAALAEMQVHDGICHLGQRVYVFVYLSAWVPTKNSRSSGLLC